MRSFDTTTLPDRACGQDQAVDLGLAGRTDPEREHRTRRVRPDRCPPTDQNLPLDLTATTSPSATTHSNASADSTPSESTNVVSHVK